MSVKLRKKQAALAAMVLALGAAVVLVQLLQVEAVVGAGAGKINRRRRDDIFVRKGG